jgi:hypothetical protein
MLGMIKPVSNAVGTDSENARREVGTFCRFE